jgi:hypothetical protein
MIKAVHVADSLQSRRHYHALGFPSRVLATERPSGEIQPVDTTRPPTMDPVCPHLISDPYR